MCHSEILRVTIFLLHYLRFLLCKKAKQKPQNLFEVVLILFMIFIATLCSINNAYLFYFFMKPKNSSNIWFLIPIPLCVAFCKIFLYLLGDWLEGSEWTEWLELLGENSIFHTKREFLFSEAKIFMKLLNATSCHCIKIQTLLSYLKQTKK